MEELSGYLLVAVPQMEDSHFARTVVLLIRHSPDEGAMGLVLNRPLSVDVEELLASVSEDLPPSDTISVRWGGPVQGPLVVLHAAEDLADLTVLPGICISTQRDRILEIVRQERQPFCFYLGYAGWGKRQLEDECEAGGWNTIPSSVELVFSDPYEMWPAACAQVNWQVIQSDPRLAKHDPTDPNIN